METTPPQVPDKTIQPQRSISVTSKTSNVYDGNQQKGPGARKRVVKYGTGKYTGVELDPQPSDSPDDPLNWSRTKKEVTFLSICMAGAIVGVFKTIFVSVNGVLATQLSVSYTAAAALTGFPMIVSAFSGIGATILAQMYGKRVIYLVSSLMMLGAALWNMDIMQNYGAFMTSRVFQSLGWGAFESLLVVSIKDIFFAHERGWRINTFNVIFIGTTWGAPILGGRISQSRHGFSDQIMYLNIAQSFSILLLMIATPETSFSRPSSSKANRTSISSITTIITTAPLPTTPMKRYLKSLHLVPYKAPYNPRTAVQSIRALAAPSTLLTFLLTMPLMASAYAVAQNLSLIFAGMPAMLFPTRIGYLFTLPCVFSILAYTLVYFSSTAFSRSAATPSSKSSMSRTLGFATAGILVGISGLLSFGFYVVYNLVPEDAATNSDFTLTLTGLNLSLQIVSLLFGLLVAGATILNLAGTAHLSSACSGNYDLSTSHQMIQNALVGIFIIGFPSWIHNLEGLKSSVIAITVLQLVLASTVGAVMWSKGDAVNQTDKRYLGFEGQTSGDEMVLRRAKTNGSVFGA